MSLPADTFIMDDIVHVPSGPSRWITVRETGSRNYVAQLVLSADGRRIESIEVAVERRRQGIATALLAWARGQGYAAEHTPEEFTSDGRAWATAVGA